MGLVQSLTRESVVPAILTGGYAPTAAAVHQPRASAVVQMVEVLVHEYRPAVDLHLSKRINGKTCQNFAKYSSNNS